MTSACPEATAPAASHPPADARSQRLAKFKREQLIVEYLNRGVSVAEIAARVGVGEKRMRAIIRDPRTGIRGLARRMPHPPEEFVAIQPSRLNEALLISFSAMSPTNLKAVDQVVKIVCELDRYGGAFAAEWARPEVSPRTIPVSQPGDPGLDDAEDSPAFLVAALPPGQSPGVGDAVDDRVYKVAGTGERPENPAQHLEEVDSAPGVSTPVAALPSGQSPGVGYAVSDRVYKPLGAGERPENPAQSPEKIDSAPEVADRVYKPVGADVRPENPAQTSEKVDSAPGVSTPVSALGSSVATRSTAAPTSPPAPANARKIRRKALKRLIPRPGRTGSPGRRPAPDAAMQSGRRSRLRRS